MCEYLRDKKGFTSCSCSDSIRAHLRQNGLEVSRENLIKGGRELRSKGGAGVLAEMLLNSNKDVLNLAVDSIRTPDEVNALKQRQKKRGRKLEDEGLDFSLNKSFHNAHFHFTPQVKKFVSEKRLTFINGGWSMHDESAPYFLDMIDNTAFGHS